jgi:hypothetical protein
MSETLRPEDARLEAALRDLGRHLEIPPTPDFAAALHLRLSERAPATSRRVPRTPLAVALAVAAVTIALVLIVAPARHAVAGWLGLAGDRIEHRTPASPPTTGSPVIDQLAGERLTLPDARRRFPGLIVPADRALGAPGAVVVGRDGALVWLAYLDERGAVTALISEFAADSGEYFHKMIGNRSGVEPATVNGSGGIWVTGPDHFVFLTDRSGGFYEDRGRLSGNALIWRQGALTIRLEGDFTKDRALAIAASLR